MWGKNGTNKTLFNETQSYNRSSILVIHNITAEDSGQYFCTAKHLNYTLTEKVDVFITCKFTLFPWIKKKYIYTGFLFVFCEEMLEFHFGAFSNLFFKMFGK